MDNQKIDFTPEVIAQQRAICEPLTERDGHVMVFRKTAHGRGVDMDMVIRQLAAYETAFPAALDALEASMAREAEKDATISRLTAERDAEKKRADALDPAIEDMKQALCCGGFGELSAACSELWRIWDQNDPEFVEHTDAPTGAESDGSHA